MKTVFDIYFEPQEFLAARNVTAAESIRKTAERFLRVIYAEIPLNFGTESCSAQLSKGFLFGVRKMSEKFLYRGLKVLSLSLLLSGASVMSFAPSVSAKPQTQEQTKNEQTADKKDKSDKKLKNQKSNKSKNNSDSATEKQTAATNRTLAVNEDPSQIGKRNINKGIGGWLGGSQNKEIAIGRQIAAEVDREAKFIDDPVITEYINRVGQNIVNNSDAKIPFTIKVIDSDEVNAFALPGGFFYVNKGLILAADNEAEVAGVMAHEIAHVAARHAMENQGKAAALQIGAMIGSIFTGGLTSLLYDNIVNIGGAALFSKLSRGAEEEADKLGVQYMYAAGYDPTAMATMFEKLASKNKKKPGTLAKVFASHPESLARREASLQLAARFPEREEYVLSSSEFQRVKARLMRLSNAKATVKGDIDDPTESGKPTLKRRAPAQDDSTTTPNDSTKPEQSDRPQLKRRSEPTPAPSPSPEK